MMKVSLSFLLCGGISLTTLAAVSPHWSGEFALPKVAPDSTCSGGVPNNMTALSSGRTYVSYRETTNGVSRFKFTWTDDHGAHWAEPRIFAPQPGIPVSSLPSVVADPADRLHWCWSSGAALHYVGLDPGSHAFSEYTLIANAGTSIGFNQITVDRSGTVHVIWHSGSTESTTESAEVWYARRPAGASGFSAPLRLSQEDGRHSAFPSADVSGAPGNLLAVAWRETTASPYSPGSNWDIKLRVSTDGGLTWLPEQTLAAGADRQFDPLLVVDRHNVIHVAYHAYPGLPLSPQSNAVHLAYSADAGVTWLNHTGTTGFTQISPPGENHSLCKAAYDFAHDVVWYFWKRRQGSAEDLVGVAVRRRGQYVSAPECLTDLAGGAAAFHNFAVGPDGRLRAHYNRSTVTPDNPFQQATLFYRERELPEPLTPTLTHLAVTPTDVTLEWPAEFGVTYAAQASINLVDWSPVLAHTATSDPVSVTFPRVAADAMAFFRLRASW